jgi:hypothetical protein
MRQERQELLISTMRHAATKLLPPARDSELPYELQLRSLAFRTGQLPVVAALAEAEQDNRFAPHARRPALLPILARAWLSKAARKLSRTASIVTRGNAPLYTATPIWASTDAAGLGASRTAALRRTWRLPSSTRADHQFTGNDRDILGLRASTARPI